jgi:hypothetical protein
VAAQQQYDAPLHVSTLQRKAIQLLPGATAFFQKCAGPSAPNTVKTPARRELWDIVVQHGSNVVHELEPEVRA